MKRFSFTTRKEVKKFLSNYNFIYYIPRLRECFENEATDYYVEINEDGQVNYCSRRYLQDGSIVNEIPFFDKDQENILDEIGEAYYKEMLELELYVHSV